MFPWKKVSAGYPPSPLEGSNDTVVSTVLREGDVIIVEPMKNGSNAPASHSLESSSTTKQVSTATSATTTTSTKLSVPHVSEKEMLSSIASQGTICLREVPDDNSCLFRCVCALIGYPNRSPGTLRQIVAETIHSRPDLYTAAVLDKSVEDYTAWIQSDNAWGGAIELALLADYYKIQFAAFDVNTMRLDRYAQQSNYPTIAFLIYDGIHYNYIALSIGEGSSTDGDITQFDPQDRYVLSKVQEIAQRLHDTRSYTDTATFKLKCMQCGTRLQGERQALAHAKSTGHSEFNEN